MSISSQLDLYIEGHPNQNPNMPFLEIDKIMLKCLYLCQNVLILEELKQSWKRKIKLDELHPPNVKTI